MQKKIRKRYEAHLRVNAVCAEFSAMFDATAGGKTMRAALGTHVADVSRLLTLQERSIEDRRAATEGNRRARVALRAAASAVVTVGRLVDLDDATMTTMRLPRFGSDEQLLAYMQALLDRVLPYADAFAAAGLPPALLQNLANGIDALAASREAQAASLQRFTAATESIRETLNRADRIVCAIEAVARAMPAADSLVLTRLHIARRVGPRVAQPPAELAPAVVEELPGQQAPWWPFRRGQKALGPPPHPAEVGPFAFLLYARLPRLKTP